ncbi:hypothetical protein LP420_32565 [Massilia sp. B-10]|nr:hypothetical protein LP420_32565 [Massilia sp. B-10]
MSYAARLIEVATGKVLAEGACKRTPRQQRWRTDLRCPGRQRRRRPEKRAGPGHDRMHRNAEERPAQPVTAAGPMIVFPLFALP